MNTPSDPAQEIEWQREELKRLQIEHPGVRTLVRTVAKSEKDVLAWQQLAARLGEKIEILQSQMQKERDLRHEDFNLLTWFEWYLKQQAEKDNMMIAANQLKIHAKQPEFSLRKFITSLKDKKGKI